MFSFAAIQALTAVLSACFGRIAPRLQSLACELWGCGTIDCVTLLASVPATLIVVVWFVGRHTVWAWPLQDAMGVALIMLLLRQFRLPDIKVARRKLSLPCAALLSQSMDSFLCFTTLDPLLSIRPGMWAMRHWLVDCSGCLESPVTTELLRSDSHAGCLHSIAVVLPLRYFLGVYHPSDHGRKERHGGGEDTCPRWKQSNEWGISEIGTHLLCSNAPYAVLQLAAVLVSTGYISCGCLHLKRALTHSDTTIYSTLGGWPCCHWHCPIRHIAAVSHPLSAPLLLSLKVVQHCGCRWRGGENRMRCCPCC